MTPLQSNKQFFTSFSAVPHQRFGNERAWSVTRGTLKRGQIVHTHAMSSSRTAILKAIAQDQAEEAQ